MFFAPDGTICLDIGGMMQANWHPDTPEHVGVESFCHDNPEYCDRSYVRLDELRDFIEQVEIHKNDDC